MLRSDNGAIGDGRDPRSDRFDLDSATVPLERLAAAGFPRDGVPALTDPVVMPGTEVQTWNDEHRGKYLVSDDRIAGVVIDGEARAYPLRVLNWHEVINDTLGDEPIAVTFHPLCDSLVIFSRRTDTTVLEFAVSGLLYNSNLLLFDRQETAEASSLWSQLLGRAIAGPAAEHGRNLERLDVALTTWGRWFSDHPDTTVVRPHPDRAKRYARNPYGNYLQTGKPRYAVEPLPPDPTRWLEWGAVDEPGGTSAVRALGPAGSVDQRTAQTYSPWFAWFAHHPSL